MSKEIPLTQGKVAIIDDEDFEYLNQWKWCAHCNYGVWYAIRSSSRRNGKRPRIFMHRVIMNIPSKLQSDHINHDGLDNRKCNLRIANPSQNRMNARKLKQASSSYKGVSWCQKDKKWMARIRINYKNFYLGEFANELDAAKAYNDKAIKLFGGFAKLNDI